VVVDTCVVISLLALDRHTVAAERAVKKAATLTLSAFVALELFDVLGRRVRDKTIPADRARMLRELFAASVAEGYWRVVEVSQSHVVTASAWLADPSLGFRAGDALHASLAHAINEPLLTSDHDLAAAAKRVGVKVHVL
jgi:predicted nucleic acid-binding protein